MNKEKQLQEIIETARKNIEQAERELAELQAEPPKFDLKKFESGEQVVNCRTEQEARDFCAWMHFVLRKKWRSERNYLTRTFWGVYETETCYAGNGGYCGIGYFECRGIQIIPYTPEIIEIRPEAGIVDVAEKLKKYCYNRRCDDCLFDSLGGCVFVAKNPSGWNLTEVE